MTKTRLLLVFASLITLALLTSFASAYGYGSFDRTYTSSSSGFSSGSHYSESPGYTQFPDESSSQRANTQRMNTNFDSTSSGYEYRGPMYEKKTTYTDTLSRDLSSRSGLFRSKSNNKLKHTITATTTEKYLGASESAYSNTQNRQINSESASQNSDYSYDGGFSFGKQRIFDSSEYASSSYRQPYYYQPNYNYNQGYYNWDY